MHFGKRYESLSPANQSLVLDFKHEAKPSYGNTISRKRSSDPSDIHNSADRCAVCGLEAHAFDAARGQQALPYATAGEGMVTFTGETTRRGQAMSCAI